jgi:ubiquinone/menaquinone biosynthesis C-methylase UbiE
MIDEDRLSEVISEDVNLRRVEPGVYSVYSQGEMPGAYDRLGVSTIYDLVACNRFYNWLMWGYSIREYTAFCQEILASSPEGWVLDTACGSLSFTAKLYSNYFNRPVILLDQSLNLIRKARSRLVKLNGRVPANIVFLHADALRLPFRAKSFANILSLNLLHCLEDVGSVLEELKRVLAPGGSAALTTLVQTSRWSDRYLNLLAASGALVSRSTNELLSAFNGSGMQVTHNIKGNLAFMQHWG